MGNFIQYCRLQNVKYETTPFTFEGMITLCKVVKVYDGDSITVVFQYNGRMRRFSVRLIGIDAPEIRTSNALEKRAALYVRNKLSIRILNRIVWFICEGEDKYGRLLGNILLPSDSCHPLKLFIPYVTRCIPDPAFYGENINIWLYKNKYVKLYSGKTKEKYTNDELMNILGLPPNEEPKPEPELKTIGETQEPKDAFVEVELNPEELDEEPVEITENDTNSEDEDNHEPSFYSQMSSSLYNAI